MPEPTAAGSAFEVLSTLWRLLGRRERRGFLGLLLVSVLMAVATLGGVASILPFFALLGDPERIAAGTALGSVYAALGFDSRGHFLVFLGCGFVFAVIAASAVNLLGNLALHRFALRIGRNFYVDLFAEYLRRDYLEHVRRGSLVLFNNITYEAPRVVTGIVAGGLTLIANLCICALMFASIVVLSPVAALAAAGLFGCTYLAIYLFVRRRLARNGQLEVEIWDSRARTLTQGLGAIREILLRGNQPFFRDAFARDCDALMRISASTFAISQAPRYALECAMAAGLVAFALWTSAAGGSTPWLAQLGFVAFAAYRILPSTQQAFAALARIRADRAALARILDDLVCARGAEARADAAPSGPGDERLWLRGELCARGLTFRYAPDAAPAVRDVTLRIPAGSAVGFVGANGSGKSTLADLLLGLLTPESGVVEVDGVALGPHNLPAWQASVACVEQTPFLLDASLAENVAFSVPREQIEADRLQRALGAAGLEELACTLPDGVWTRLGERGARLSGGQRQRIGIARALYRDSSVLVLDEATAALDGIAERELVRTLAKLRPFVTVIAIAHRMASVRDCDVIYEMDHGRVVNAGSFDELMRRSTRFREIAGAGA